MARKLAVVEDDVLKGMNPESFFDDLKAASLATSEGVQMSFRLGLRLSYLGDDRPFASAFLNSKASKDAGPGGKPRFILPSIILPQSIKTDEQIVMFVMDMTEGISNWDEVPFVVGSLAEIKLIQAGRISKNGRRLKDMVWIKPQLQHQLIGLNYEDVPAKFELDQNHIDTLVSTCIMRVHRETLQAADSIRSWEEEVRQTGW